MAKNAKQTWMKQYMQHLVGRTITKVGVTSDGFPYFELDDKTLVEVSQDAEGNGPGFLFGLQQP